MRPQVTTQSYSLRIKQLEFASVTVSKLLFSLDSELVVNYPLEV
jgi:hypothetical protein